MRGKLAHENEKGKTDPVSTSRASSSAGERLKRREDFQTPAQEKIVLVPSSMLLESKSEELDPIDLPRADKLEPISRTQATPNIVVSPDMYATPNFPVLQKKESQEAMEVEEFSSSFDKSQASSQGQGAVVIVDRGFAPTSGETRAPLSPSLTSLEQSSDGADAGLSQGLVLPQVSAQQEGKDFKPKDEEEGSL